MKKPNLNKNNYHFHNLHIKIYQINLKKIQNINFHSTQFCIGPLQLKIQSSIPARQVIFRKYELYVFHLLFDDIYHE